MANSPPSPVSVRNACLLKTAIATVSAGPISAEGNIFFNEGDQRSFISQDLADKLCLKATHTERISLSSFGNTVSATRSLQVASISVHTQDQSAIPMSVLVVPKLAAPLQNSIRMEIRNVPYLKDLKLTHPVTEDDNFEINILVGLTTTIGRSSKTKIICGNGPTAVQSCLGYLLSGPLLQSSAAVSLNFTAMDNQDLDAFWTTEASRISMDTELMIPS